MNRAETCGQGSGGVWRCFDRLSTTPTPIQRSAAALHDAMVFLERDKGSKVSGKFLGKAPAVGGDEGGRFAVHEVLAGSVRREKRLDDGPLLIGHGQLSRVERQRAGEGVIFVYIFLKGEKTKRGRQGGRRGWNFVHYFSKRKKTNRRPW